MRSLILLVATRLLLPLLLLFSIFLLIRGHNLPGGGFVGGLMAAAGFALYTLAAGAAHARAALRLSPRLLIAFGLAAALLSALWGPFTGKPILTAAWIAHIVPVIGKVGVPLVFDVGVYLVVIGVALNIVLDLAEEDS